jgi:hypothetical protein
MYKLSDLYYHHIRSTIQWLFGGGNKYQDRVLSLLGSFMSSAGAVGNSCLITTGVQHPARRNDITRIDTFISFHSIVFLVV